MTMDENEAFRRSLAASPPDPVREPTLWAVSQPEYVLGLPLKNAPAPTVAAPVTTAVATPGAGGPVHQEAPAEPRAASVSPLAAGTPSAGASVDPPAPAGSEVVSGTLPAGGWTRRAPSEHVAGHCERCWIEAGHIAFRDSTSQPAEYQRLIAAEGHPRAAAPAPVAKSPGRERCPTCGQVTS